MAVIGSVLSTRYQDRMTSALAALHVPAGVTRTILGSLGGALGVAAHVGGATGALLALTARIGLHERRRVSLAVGAVVAIGGGLLALAALPSPPRRRHARTAPARPRGTAGPAPAAQPGTAQSRTASPIPVRATSPRSTLPGIRRATGGPAVLPTNAPTAKAAAAVQSTWPNIDAA